MDNRRYKYRLIYVFMLATFFASCAREENPYLNRYRGQIGDAGEKSNATGTGNSQGVVTPDNQVVESADPEVASPETIPEEALKFTEVLCAQGPNLKDMTTEFNVLCVDGKPSSLLAELLEGGYTGEGEPNVRVLQSELVGGNSQLLYATSSVISASTEEILTRRNRLSKSCA